MLCRFGGVSQANHKQPLIAIMLILFLLYDIVNYQNQLVMFTSVGIHFECETTDQTQ